MKNILQNNIFPMKKKKHSIPKKKNKSLIETNKSNISGIKSVNNNKKNKINYYINIMNKTLYSKYNTSPKQHDMIPLENVVQSKYCHDLAVFKEKILFNYNEEFLRRFYNEEESITRIPKFVVYYKNYLVYFCKPIFSELNLNDYLQAYNEKKAQIFYNDNYKDDTIKDDKEKKNNYFTLFTPKIRKLISNNNSLSNLTINISNNQNNNNQTFISMENSIIKIIKDLTLQKNPIKQNKKLPLNKEKKVMKENHNKTKSKTIFNNSNSDNNNNNEKTIKNNSLGKNLFFIYNQNFKKIISNHIHTKTESNLNFFKDKVFSERKNSKKKSNSKISFSKNKNKRSRNVIISNPFLTDLRVYTYRFENKNKKQLNNTNYNTINYQHFIDKKPNIRSITERNNKNLIKAMKNVENIDFKKMKNNKSRNVNRNSLNLNIFSSVKVKSENNFNEHVLKTDNNEKNKIKNKNLKDSLKININNHHYIKGINNIEKYIQLHKKIFKK
jgi:hypothetical protein